MENNKNHEVFRACLRHCSGTVRVSGMFLNFLLPPFASALTPFALFFFLKNALFEPFTPFCNPFASSANTLFSQKTPSAPLRTPLTLLSESPLPSTASLSTPPNNIRDIRIFRTRACFFEIKNSVKTKIFEKILENLLEKVYNVKKDEAVISLAVRGFLPNIRTKKQ